MASKVYQVFLCSRIIACILPTSHFQISKHTLPFSVFKLKLLVSVSLSLSITLSFKPHCTTSTNQWCYHSPPVSNIVPVLSWKNQWLKGQRAGESPGMAEKIKWRFWVKFSTSRYPLTGQNPIFTLVWLKWSLYDRYLIRNEITTFLYWLTYRNRKYRPVRFEIVFLVWNWKFKSTESRIGYIIIIFFQENGYGIHTRANINLYSRIGYKKWWWDPKYESQWIICLNYYD